MRGCSKATNFTARKRIVNGLSPGPRGLKRKKRQPAIVRGLVSHSYYSFSIGQSVPAVDLTQERHTDNSQSREWSRGLYNHVR